MARKRRGRGEGAIYQRKSDGLWCFAYEIGRNEQGKPLRRTFTSKFKHVVLDKMRDGLAGNTPQQNRSSMTVKDLMGKWLDSEHRENVKVQTFALDKSIIERHVLPYIGGIKLKSLSTEDMKNFFVGLRERGVNRAAQMAYVFLKCAFEYAVEAKELDRNPLVSVPKPRASLRKARPWTYDEALEFLSVAERENDHYLPVYEILLGTGLREGEAFGLEWRHIDFDNHVVHVRHQLNERDTGQTIGHVKSERGVRDVPVSKRFVKSLSRLKLCLDPKRPMIILPTEDAHGQIIEDREYDLVFRSPEGTAIRRSNFQRRSFFPLIKESKVPKVRIHDLRHTHGTHLHDSGVDPKTAAERMGHDLLVYLKTYVHTNKEQHDFAAKKFEAGFDAAAASFEKRKAAQTTVKLQLDENHEKST